MIRVVTAITIVALALSASAQEAQKTPRQVRRAALEGLVESEGEAALRQFVDVHVAPAFRDSLGAEALFERLRGIRAACTDAGGVLVRPLSDDAFRVTFLQGPRETSVVCRLEAVPLHRIVALDLEPSQESRRPHADVPPVTWDALEMRLEEEAKAGFSGTVLVVHGGKIVLHRGYGLADRERRLSNGTETIFAIGSVPIDFTKAAILKLEEMGALRTSDGIAKFFARVPADKSSMTIDQLMTGRSGLPNFHHVVGVDADPDLSWIDRETAIRRILAQDLSFPPGQGQAHSHSAWVLLAALVEIASKQSYGEFLQQHFFGPAGMTRTGLHEDDRFTDDDFALGYEAQSFGSRNSPRYWGKTSWLVMGSGGMESTPGDLFRWMSAIRSGKTLSPAAAARYWTHGVLEGGDDRGFLCVYTEGPEDLVILCSNAHAGPSDRTSALAERLAALVQPSPRPSVPD